MIIYFISKFVLWLIGIVISPLLLFPDVVIDTNIISSIITAGNYIKTLDFIFPVSGFLIVFGIYISIEIGIFGYKIIKWVYNKIPGVS